MSKDASSKPVSKAGIILFDRGEARGEGAEGEKWKRPDGLSVLATYTQGRFDEHGIYLVPPKGSIDPLKDEDGAPLTVDGKEIHELPLVAAVRECREETGIDIVKLLGEHAQDFLAGKTIEHVMSTGYPGVEIIRASPQPVKDHTYVSGHGSRQRAQYFSIEIRGIEKLRGELKCIVPGEHAMKPEARVLSSELAVQKGLPSFKEMMNILRSGIVPVSKGALWSPDAPQRIIAQPKLAKLEQHWLKQHHRKHKHFTQSEWLEFIADPALGKDYKPLQENIEALKHYLEGKQLVGDCEGCMKIDTKDRPLNFYKEGGYIGRAGDVIMAMETAADRNATYARAVWGEYSGAKKPAVSEAEQMQRAQVAPFIEYLAELCPMEVASAAIRKPASLRALEREDGHVPIAPRAMRAVSFADDVMARRVEAARLGQGV